MGEGAGRRLHQADQDGHRADHLLHRRVGHRPHRGCDARSAAWASRRSSTSRSYRRWRSPSASLVGNFVRPGEGFSGAAGDAAAVAAVRRSRRAPVDRRVHPAHHSRQPRRRLCRRQHPAGAAHRHPVRFCADGAGRARARGAHPGRRPRPRLLRHHRRHHEGGTDRRLRRHGLHHRQVRPGSDRQSRWAHRHVLCHGGDLHLPRAGHHCLGGGIQHLSLPRLHQGRAAVGARHLARRKAPCRS